MTNAGKKADSDRELKNNSLLPIAWQPLTPRGVAAFVETTCGRVVLVELFFALLAAASVVWFLHDDWFPTIREAISHLPSRGEIRQGELKWHEETPTLLAASRFLSFTVDADHTGKEGHEAHVCAEFGRNELRLVSLFGYVPIRYPKNSVIAFNRPELDPWWGAWRPMILAIVALFVIAYLFICWFVLATLYSFVALLIAFFANRKLTWKESWKLSSAALMPGALFLTLAIVAYGMGLIDLIRLGFGFGFHLVIGWAYLGVSPFFLPLHPAVQAQKKNPFGSSAENQKPRG